MRNFKSARWLFSALLLVFLIPTPQARAGVFLSVNFAPPVLPVYEQPPCPEPGLMWSPGYWAYGEDGYYWVPGAWVPAPYQGALWTPPYWGWNAGLYVFHPGYWGNEVGYYGGVNYGFGYMGVGFVGGRWDHDRFMYNTAVMRVNTTVIHQTYVDRTIVREHVVERNSRVAYAGGPGGIHHDPTPQERQAMQMRHLPPTKFQEQHVQTARTDRGNYFKANHGHPQQVALARPLPAEHQAPPTPLNRGGNAARPGQENRPGQMNQNGNTRGDFRNNTPNARPGMQQAPAQRQEMNRGPQTRPQNQPEMNRRNDNQPAQPRFQQQNRPNQQGPEARPAPQFRQQQQQRPEPQFRQQQQQRPEPQFRQQQQRQQQRPEPQFRQQQQRRPAPENRPQNEPRRDFHPNRPQR